VINVALIQQEAAELAKEGSASKIGAALLRARAESISDCDEEIDGLTLTDEDGDLVEVAFDDQAAECEELAIRIESTL
jgi:hypothetical protein